uniref:Uncharacterized protein n=1 Tax=Phlebotomus papatasi TaxID=29031 RepID=A0A1B0DL35_PHLPP
MSQGLTQAGPPNYDSVEAVQDDVTNLMTRMQALTNFIHGQNDMASLLGEDAAVAMAEQAMLQKKLQELKDRKSQMEKLVSELQNMNVEADRAFAENGQNGGMMNGNEAARIVPVSLERIVPIELLGSPAPAQAAAPLQPSNTQSDIESETENAELEGMEEAEGGNSVIGEKIAEINAMKDQLNRLKDMMETVKLIEMKTAMGGPEEIDEDAQVKPTETPEQLNNLSGNHSAPAAAAAAAAAGQKVSNAEFDRPQRDESVLSDRVQALHAMTQDLRAQALSLVSERERLKTIKDEMERRRDEMLEKTSNQSGSTIREVTPGPQEREHQRLKEEYDAKRKEYEKIVEKLEAEQRQAPWNAPPPSNPAPSVQQPPRTNSVRPCGTCSKQMSTESTESTMPIDAASLKSGSTKSLQQIGMDRSAASGASGSAWRKTSRDNVEMSPGNATPHPLSIPTNHFSPCNSFYAGPTQNFCPQNHPGCNVDHQSPQCHHHHLANEPFYGSVYTGSRGDSLLLQQFIQTQQMLINSVSQCNQLLWSQQRELNNLNNAVLLLQERLLKQDGHESAIVANSMRAESVPPNVATTSTGNQISSFLQRAQSEQPSFYATGQNQFPPPLSPVRIYPNYQNQILRNQAANSVGGSNNSVNNRVARVAGNVQQSPANGFYQNGGGGDGGQQQQSLFGNLNPFSNANNANQGNQQPVLLNNNPNSILNAQTTATPIFIHHNNNTSGGNNANLQHHHQNATVANTAFATHVPPPALNNQVAPGNRANNYWDNFRR